MNNKFKTDEEIAKLMLKVMKQISHDISDEMKVTIHDKRESRNYRTYWDNRWAQRRVIMMHTTTFKSEVDDL